MDSGPVHRYRGAVADLQPFSLLNSLLQPSSLSAIGSRPRCDVLDRLKKSHCETPPLEKERYSVCILSLSSVECTAVKG